MLGRLHLVVHKSFMIDESVFSRYNNKTYRVDDINWDAHPGDTFELYDGSTITFADYYKKVGFIACSVQEST